MTLITVTTQEETSAHTRLISYHCKFCFVLFLNYGPLSIEKYSCAMQKLQVQISAGCQFKSLLNFCLIFSCRVIMFNAIKYKATFKGTEKQELGRDVFVERTDWFRIQHRHVAAFDLRLFTTETINLWLKLSLLFNPVTGFGFWRQGAEIGVIFKDEFKQKTQLIFSSSFQVKEVEEWRLSSINRYKFPTSFLVCSHLELKGETVVIKHKSCIKTISKRLLLAKLRKKKYKTVEHCASSPTEPVFDFCLYLLCKK